MGRNSRTDSTAELILEPFQVPNLHETIQSRLGHFINDQGLVAGDRLPAQATLARALDVSVVSLREALRAMGALGIVEARVGSGWYVRDFSFDPVAKAMAFSFELNQHSFVDLVDIRIRLECSYLPQVLPKLSSSDLEQMEALVREMEQVADAGEEFDEPDRAFHMRMFAGKVGNQFFTDILDAFWTLYSHIPPPSERVQRQVLVDDAKRHRLILEAVKEADEELAVQRLLDSLQGAVQRTSRLTRPSTGSS